MSIFIHFVTLQDKDIIKSGREKYVQSQSSHAQVEKGEGHIIPLGFSIESVILKVKIESIKELDSKSWVMLERRFQF